MENVINGVKVPFIPIVTNNDFGPAKVKHGTESFGAIFDRELEKIKFSSHAVKRLESRNIQLNETAMTKLNQAVEKAEAKGSKDSLVMMNDTAFIVNVPNRTVVTAMDVTNNNENVFTNIDSVVFI
jgi:flagellar operon protein